MRIAAASVRTGFAMTGGRPDALFPMVSTWGGVKVGSLRAADSRPYLRAAGGVGPYAGTGPLFSLKLSKR